MKRNWPGTHPPTPREIQAANQRLLTAMRRHRDLKRKLALAEYQLREAKAQVKALLEYVLRGQPTVYCEECHAGLGTNPHCLRCQAHGLLVQPQEGGK